MTHLQPCPIIQFKLEWASYFQIVLCYAGSYATEKYSQLTLLETATFP